MSTEPVIDIRDVCFSYDMQEVLHNVTLQVEERSLLAMVGPNGGGKSTLLKLILGLLRPQRGTLRVFGGAPAAARRRIGYVPQQLHFDAAFPVCVLDVVLMGRVERHWAGPYRASDRSAARHALSQVRLEEMSSRPFSDLSGGERQRVLIAQALVSEPDLLLLDEPTANVDAVVEHGIYDLLHDLNERLTIVVISHNLNVVTRHASHVACVNRSAELHKTTDMSAKCLHATYGTDMTVLHHDEECHVLDSSRAMHEPHHADPHTEDST